MMLACTLLSLCWIIASAQPSSGGKAKVNYEYQLYLPKSYNSDKLVYPLIIYLHGGSQRGKDLRKLNVYGLPHLVDLGQDFDCIIASPQCPEEKFWSTDNWFEPLYQELTSRDRVDPKRVYLTGISMGGYGTWQTAVAYPAKFAAIVPLCGGCDDSTQVCKIKKIPVWAFHGTADDAVSIDETRRLVRRLEQCNGNVKFTELANEGHAIQFIYEDKSVYNWLLKQHR